ncbi:hypothetical protein E3N88_08703 [Mikania micrantha]|uniref:Bifunctional inhibitor/plant lipid transfer protein/seed storage helical domain-containing protein n=1 Tax=Mikania micrantha TaxID=192012 RepID=A0A5N6PHX5_9ASTR|nr:hypothetical protein E3N88_08703 [Mikania micrantha]
MVIIASSEALGFEKQCHNKIPIDQVNHCKMHLTQGVIISNDVPKMVVNRRPMQQQHLQQCCTQLKKVSHECQCDAIQRGYDEARRQGGVIEMRLILEVLDCPLVSPRVN